MTLRQLALATLLAAGNLRGEPCPATLDETRASAERYIHAGQFQAAEEYIVGCLKPWRSQLPRGHPEILASTAQLGMVISALGRLDEAEALLRENYRLAQQPGKQSALAFTAAYLGSLYRYREQTERALPLLRLAHAKFLEAYGADHASTGLTLAELGVVYATDGQSALAERAFVEARRVLKLNGLHSEARTTQVYMGTLQTDQGRHAEAEENLRSAMDTGADTSVLAMPTKILGLYRLARLYRSQNKTEAAVECYEAAIASAEESPLPAIPPLEVVVAEYADFLKQSRSPEARVWAAKAKSLLAKKRR